MRFRIVTGHGQGYQVEYVEAGTSYWHTYPNGHCITRWGARFKVWRLKRRAQTGKLMGWKKEVVS